MKKIKSAFYGTILTAGLMSLSTPSFANSCYTNATNNHSSCLKSAKTLESVQECNKRQRAATKTCNNGKALKQSAAQKDAMKKSKEAKKKMDESSLSIGDE